MEEDKSENEHDELDDRNKKKHESEDEHDKKKEHKEKHHSRTEKNFTDAVRKNPWIASTIILGVVFLVLLIGGFGGTTGNVSKNKASDNLNDFLQFKTSGAEILQLESYNNYLYQADISLEGQEIPLYITKDGKFLVQGLTPLELETSTPTSTPIQTDVPKSDKPVVELFVMTHCPYGTQAEKGFIPAILELENKIDAKIRFVHYFLHAPEEDETPIQVCLREEQSEKFLPYLKCFLEDGDSDRCLTAVGVNKNKLNTCVSTNADGYYAVDSELSEGYGVKGSPTLVINGVQSSAGRSAQAYLDGICDAFNGSPEECSSSLDNTNPSAGFGYGTTSGIAQAQC